MTVHGPRALSDLRAALSGMLNDPDVTEDLLLVGVALADHVCTSPPPWRLEDAVIRVYNCRRNVAVHRARTELAMDVPRCDELGRAVGGALARHLPLIDWRRVWDEFGGAERPVDTNPNGGRLIIDPHADVVTVDVGPQLRLVT